MIQFGVQPKVLDIEESMPEAFVSKTTGQLVAFNCHSLFISKLIVISSQILLHCKKIYIQQLQIPVLHHSIAQTFLLVRIDKPNLSQPQNDQNQETYM